MLRLTGCILVIAGCTGFAGCICRELSMRLELLKYLRSTYENLKYYIAYQRATVPEALGALARDGEPFEEAFREICARSCEGGESFPALWQECMGEAAENSVLRPREKKLICDFPSCLGFMEENAQARALDELLREVQAQIGELERERKNRNKLIMSLGAAGGALISLILL